MPSLHRPLLSILTISLACAPGLLAQETGPMAGYWTCQSYPADGPTYVNAPFDQMALASELNLGWKQLLLTKYGSKPGGSCGMAYKSGVTLDKLKTDAQRGAEQLRQQGKKVVETAWIFVPEKATLPYFCHAAAGRQPGHKDIEYLHTAVLTVPGSQKTQLNQAWRDYLDTVHPGLFWNPSNCFLLAADPEINQQTIQTDAGQWQSKGKVSQTEWTFTPGHATSGASISPASSTPAASSTAPTPAPHPSAAGPAPGAPASSVSQPAQSTPAAPATAQVSNSHAAIASVMHPAAAIPTRPVTPPVTPKTPAYFCQATGVPTKGQKQLLYLTEVFTSTTPPVSITKSWQQHVAGSNSADSRKNGTCRRLPSDSASQQNMYSTTLRMAEMDKVELVKVQWQD